MVVVCGGLVFLFFLVFDQARDFNGDIAAWDVSKVKDMGASMYTLTLFPPRSFFFLPSIFLPRSPVVPVLILFHSLCGILWCSV